MAGEITATFLTLKFKNMKYSLWKLRHENCCVVTAHKVKDTNSAKEVDRHIEQSWMNAASFYREEDELNAEYLQTFEAE